MKKIPASLLTVALSLSVYSFASTQTWNNAAGGDWNTTANWTPAVVPGVGVAGANDIGLFTTNPTVPANVDVSASLTALQGITLQNGGNLNFTRSNSSTITLTTTPTILINPTLGTVAYTVDVPLILADNLTVTQATDAAITFKGPISDSPTGKTILYRNTSGTNTKLITLDGVASTYGGTTTVNFSQVKALNSTTAFPSGGTVNVTNGGKVIFDTSGTTSTGLIASLTNTSSMDQLNAAPIYLQQLTGTGTVNLDSTTGGPIHFVGTSPFTFAGEFNGGTVSLSADFTTGSRLLFEGAQTVTLSGNSTLGTGLLSRTFISSGSTVELTNKNSLGNDTPSAGSPVFVRNKGQLTLNFPQTTFDKRLYLNGAGNTSSCPLPDGSDNLGALLSKNVPHTIGKNIIIGWANSPEVAKDAAINTQTDLSLSGVISGAASLIKTGPADLKFLGNTNNSLSNPIIILNGTFTPNKGVGFTPFAGDLYIANDGALNYNMDQGSLTSAQTIFMNGAGISNNGAIVASGTATTLASKIVAGWTTFSTSCVTSSLDSVINVVGSTAFSLTGVIDGNTVNLTKIGTGSLTLNNSANTFAKAWTVSAGELIAPNLGSISSSSSITVKSGGQLTLNFPSALDLAVPLTLEGLGNTSNTCPVVGDNFGAILINATTSTDLTTLSGTLTVPSTLDAVLNTKTPLNLSGAITTSGTGGIWKTGAADLSFTGSSSNSGLTSPITLLNGTFSPAKTSGTPFAGDLYIDSGAALNYSQNQTALVGTQTIFLNGTGISNNGAMHISDTATTLGSKIVVGWDSTSHPVGSCSIAASDASINVAVTSFSLGGSLSGSQNLTKIGTGELILNGSGSGFSGNWTISKGQVTPKLLASLGSGEVTIESSGQLNFDFALAGSLPNNFILNGFGDTTNTCPAIADTFGAIVNKTGSNTINGTVSLASDAVINTNANLVIDGAISGSGKLYKTGTANLKFTGTDENTFTTDFTVLNGTFTPAKNTNLLAPYKGDLYLSDGATMIYSTDQALPNGKTIFINGGGYTGQGGVIVSSGTTTIPSNLQVGWTSACVTPAVNATIKVGGTSLQLDGSLIGSSDLSKDGTGNLILNGSSGNTFSGTLKVLAGSLIAKYPTSMGTGSAEVTSLAGLTLDTTTGGSFPNNLTLNGFGLGIATSSCPVDTAGALVNLSGVNTITGTLSLASDSVIATAEGLLIDGAISGAGKLYKTGAADLSFTGSTSNSGLTTSITLLNGTFTPAKTSGTPFAGDLYIASGAALNYTQDQSLLGTQTISINGTGVSSGGAIAASGTTTLAPKIVVGWTSTSPCSISASDASINVASGGSLSLTGVLDGTTNNLEKIGTGSLVLDGSAANTFTKNWTISAGEVIAKRLDSIGASAATATVTSGGQLTLDMATAGSLPNNLTLNGFGLGSATCPTDTAGAILNKTGANIIAGTVTLASNSSIATGADLEMSKAMSGAFNLYKTGTADLKFTGPSNSFTDLTILNGTFTPAKAGADLFTGDLYIADGATMIFNSAETFPAGKKIFLNGAGYGIQGGAIVSSGTRTLSSDIQIGWTSACVPSAADVTLNVGSASLTLSGALSGSQNLTKIGGGELILTGGNSNTLTGDLTVSAGKLTLSKTNPKVAIAGNLIINGGDVVDNVNNQISPTSTVSLLSGSLDLGTFNEEIKTFKYTGGTFTRGTGSFKLNAATGDALILGNGITLSGQTTTLTGCGGAVHLIGTASNATIDDIDLGVTACTTQRPIIVDDVGSTLTIKASTGTSGFDKQGPGTLLFSTGPHVFSANCKVSAGTLILDSDFTITGQKLIVDTGANLFLNAPHLVHSPLLTGSLPVMIDNSGFSCISGTVNGSVINEIPGTLAGVGNINGDFTNFGLLSTGACGGNDIGTLTIGGNADFKAGSKFLVNIDPNIPVTSDLLKLQAGTANIESGALIEIVPLSAGNFPPIFFTTIIDAKSVAGTFTLSQPFPLFQFSIDYDENSVRIQREFTGIPCGLKNPIASTIDSDPDLFNPLINDMIFMQCDEIATALDQMDPSSIKDLSIIHNDNNGAIRDSIWRRQNAFLFGTCNQTCPKGKPYSVWMEVDGGHVKQRKEANQVGYKANSAYVTLGVDHHEACDFNGGIALSYSFSKADWNKRIGDGRVNAGYLTGYATKKWDHLFVGGTLGGQYSHSTYYRNIAFGNSFQSTNERAKGAFSSSGVMAGIQVGASKTSAQWEFRPVASVDYNHQTDNQFSEREGGLYNMKFKQAKHYLLRAEAGIDLVRCFGDLSLDWKLSYIREQRFGDKTYKASFVHFSSPITFDAFSPSRNLGTTGLDATYKAKDGKGFIRAGYNIKIGKRYTNHLGSLETGVNF